MWIHLTKLNYVVTCVFDLCDLKVKINATPKGAELGHTVASEASVRPWAVV